MKRATSDEVIVDALGAISLATWNRARSTNELRSFLDKREAVVANVVL